MLLADVCMHAVSVLARARRVSAAVQAAVNSEAAVAAAVAASSSAAAPPRALGQSAGPLPPPGEWRLPPVLTWLVMEKWLRAQGAWRALASASAGPRAAPTSVPRRSARRLPARTPPVLGPPSARTTWHDCAERFGPQATALKPNPESPRPEP